MKSGFRYFCFICASLLATQMVAADMSGWSDKTVCRLVKSGGHSDANEEAILRGLNCIASIKPIKPYYSTSVNAVKRGMFGGFNRSLNNKPHGYAVIDDPTGSAPTKRVEVFEVRPGDCAKSKWWDDCKKDRERSELSESGKKRARSGSEYWYGWNIYFPEDYINIYPTKTALGQFHQDGSHPVWMFQNGKGGYHLDDQVYGGTRKYFELISEKNLRGQWHQIEVHAKWEKDRTGIFQVWVNGELKVDYTGQTMTAKKVYFKYGIYRSFMSRYKNKTNTTEVPAQTVYYSNVKKGLTRESLEAQ
jgi:hypothetical protein